MCNFKYRRYSRRNKKGAIIVLVAVILAALMVFVGFSVDLAHMQRVRTELRVATDLAAKAAAGTLSATGDINQAVLAGQEVAQNNQVAGAPLTLAGGGLPIWAIDQATQWVLDILGRSHAVQLGSRDRTTHVRVRGWPRGPVFRRLLWRRRLRNAN